MSAFGTTQSQEAGGQSLTGAIVSKMQKSRKKARAKDKKDNKNSTPDSAAQDTTNSPQQPSSNSSSSKKKSIFGNPFAALKQKLNFKGKSPKTGEKLNDEKTGKTPGLLRILTKGFGILATDTSQIQGNLSQIGEILNRQLGIQDFTSGSLTGVQSILSDQLENQVSIIEALGGTAPTRSSGGGGPSAFGSAQSQAAGGDTLTGFIAQKIKEVTDALLPGLAGGILSRIGPRLLLNPWTAVIAGGAILGMTAAEGIKNKPKFSQDPITNDPEKDKKIRENLAPTLGGTMQVSHPSYLPGGDPRRWPYDNPGKPIPKNIQDQINGMPKAGPWQKWSSGRKSMIGEAGKERVVQLNSRDANNVQSNDSNAAMKTTGGSLLSVVDQFIKSMGPLGGSVAGIVGPQAANLANQFELSGGLLNFKMNASTFKDNADTKKKRDSFMNKLISDSLKALGAKKKEKPKTPPSVGPGGPGTTGTPQQQQDADERANKAMEDLPGGGTMRTVTNKDGTQQEIRESRAKIFGSNLYTSKDKDNKPIDVKGPGLAYRPVEGTNGSRWYDVDGRLYSWQPGTTVKELSKDELTKGWNGKPFIRKPDTGHVRINEEDWTPTGTYQRPPALGEYSYKFGKLWTKGSTGKEGWMEPPNGPFGGKASALPPSNNIQFDTGGRVVTVNGERIQVDKNGYPDSDGYFNPFGYGGGIPNPFVSDRRRQALSIQRETARQNSPGYRGMQVLTGERLITGGTTQDLNNYNRGYASGGSAIPKVTPLKAEDGMIGPSWLPWNWGKLVDNQRKTNMGMGYEGRNSSVTDPEMRRMMGLPPLKGFAEGGSAFTTLRSNTGRGGDPRIAAIEDTLKVLTIKMSRMEQPKSVSASPPPSMAVTSQAANEDTPMIINNIMSASGGGASMGGGSSADTYRTSDTARAPDASGTAALLNRSPHAVYR